MSRIGKIPPTVKRMGDSPALIPPLFFIENGLSLKTIGGSTLAARNTIQQSAIREALRSAGRPLAPGEILDVARPAAPRLGLATVYRSIQRLLVGQEICRVQVPGLADRYEWTDRSHRHYFLCRDCRRLFDLKSCPGGIENLAPRGFKAEDHDLIIHGLCPDCREVNS